MLGTVSEVRMPVRFIFVLMGPTSKYMFSEDYVEIGRALSTLMSYKVSHGRTAWALSRTKICHQKGYNELFLVGFI